MVRQERLTATLEGEFVVFMIGMRINHPLKVHKWLPVATAMPRMLKELYRQPELGVLHAEIWFSRTVILVQYWRSMDQLIADRNSDQVKSNHNQDSLRLRFQYGVSPNTQPETSMEVTLVDRVPAFVAYQRHTGPYGKPLSLFWQQTIYPWLRENSLLEQPRYGISHDDPSITEPDRCRYDACVEVPPLFKPSRSVLTATIPGGRYAVLRFKGTAGEIGEAWNDLLRDWLPSSGLQLDARPCFEYYPKGSTHDAQTGVFDCDICIPVAAL